LTEGFDILAGAGPSCWWRQRRPSSPISRVRPDPPFAVSVWCSSCRPGGAKSGLTYRFSRSIQSKI